MKFIAFIVVLFLSLFSYGQVWKIMESHKVIFANKDVSGTFDAISGTIVFDPSSLTTAKFNFKLKTESINTGNGLQNKHALGDEWFNAEKYPFIEFVSSKIEKTDNGFKAIGELEMHGVSKEITIPFTFAKKGSGGTFVAKFTVNRTDYNVGKKGNDVADAIKITATIPVQKNK